MQKVYISVGSNMGADARINVSDAISFLKARLADMRSSSIYSTPPLNGLGPDYSNAVVCGYTDMDADTLIAGLKDYERMHGRTAELKALGMVPIDLDLVIYGGLTLRERDASAYFFTRGYDELIGSEKAPSERME
ncbi:MAG: 2-amino-4-hydroxy-6-hydroxymethyldihydropteridine diphosphokinase [Muribaculaceae bacterium]|nr:2-amino-4-hydroxy-6-hydroxymethyldihydropteridine diphosphokinase [Muribaculaceae bacterium]